MHYRNNGELACQMCHAGMSQEEYDFCDICPECRDNEEW
jgi:uncharacterized CHY-type Zn-finger protein